MAEIRGDTKAIFAIFVGTIIAVVFLGSIGDSISDQITTFSVENVTVTVSAINESLALTGRDLIGTGTVSNDTFSEVTGAAFFNGLIISDGIVGGAKTVRITANDTASDRVGDDVNVTYSYNPDGYLTQSSDRSIAALILIFGSLAIVVFVIVVLFKTGSFSEIANIARRRKK